MEVNVNTLADGNDGGYLKGMLNIPLAGGQSALRVVGYATAYAGFIDALGENGAREDDVNSGNRSGGRIALLWQAADHLTITPRLVYQEVNTDGFNRQEVYNLFANPWSTTRPAIQLDKREQYLLQGEKFSDETLIFDVTVEWGLQNFDMTVAASYTDREILVSRDASALTGSVTVSPLGSLGFPESAVTIPSNLRDTTDFEQATFELRLNSNNDGPWQWLAGVFIADAERNYAQRLPTPGYDAIVDGALGAGTVAATNGVEVDSPYSSDLPYQNRQTAIFAELSYDFSDRFQLTVGGRYHEFEEDRRFTSRGLFSNGDDQLDETSSDGFTPRLMFSYDLTENTVLNAQTSQGFRQGGDNDPLNEGVCSEDDVITFGGFPEYDDEKLWNYETGIKSRFDNGPSLKAAVFYTDIENLQVTQDAGSCSSRVVFNVKDAHTAGVELELSAQPSERLMLSLAATFLEAEFDSTIYKAGGTPLGGMESGNRLPSVAEAQLASTAVYTFPISWAAGAEAFLAATVHYLSDRFTQPGDQVPGAGSFSHFAYAGASGAEVTRLDLELDPYTLVDVSAGITGNNWEVVLYINNVADENADLSFDRERGGAARLAFRTNLPRNLGLTFRKHF